MHKDKAPEIWNRFEKVAFQANVALPEEGAFISGMGLDFRDFGIFANPGVGTFDRSSRLRAIAAAPSETSMAMDESILW